MRRAWMAAPALFLSAAAIAADVAGSADLERVPRFAQAQIIDYRQSTVQERIYPQDSIRRISGNLRMAAQVVASGRLTAVTYQLPASHTGIGAFTRPAATCWSRVPNCCSGAKGASAAPAACGPTPSSANPCSTGRKRSRPIYWLACQKGKPRDRTT